MENDNIKVVRDVKNIENPNIKAVKLSRYITDLLKKDALTRTLSCGSVPASLF